MKTHWYAKLFGYIAAASAASCGVPALQIGHLGGMSINCFLAALFTGLGIHAASNTGGQN